MAAAAIHDLALALPKAELHLHIEGSLEPELMFKLAHRNNVAIPYKTVEDVRAAYKFTNLQTFLDIYYAGASVLITAEDFAELTLAYIQRAHSEGLRHCEIFFDPQTHTARGIKFETVVDGIEAGLREGKERFGVSSVLILSFLRHLSEEECFECLELAMPHLARFGGVGLDSSEVGHPPSKFSRLFAKCRELGLRVVAHAGEEAPPTYIWEALNDLQVCRIDHGVQSEKDEALLEHLAKTKTPLTVCPTSNISLRVFNDMADHNVVRLLRRGLMVMVNSDDPAYFGGYLLANYEGLAACGATPEDLVQLAKNSFTSSWLPDAEKARYFAEIDAVFAKWQAAQ